MKHKTITLVTSYKFPDDAATANRLSVFSDVLDSYTNYKVIVVGRGDKDKNFYLYSKNISVIQLTERKFNKKNLFVRGVNELLFSLRLLHTARKTNADAYLVSIPSVTLLVAFISLFKQTVIYDVRDLVWEFLIKSKGVKKFAGIILKIISLTILRRSCLITVTNDAELQYLRGKNFPVVHKISNGISQKKFEILANFEPKIYRNSEEYLIVYVGNVGFAQNLKTVVDVVGNLSGFRLVIIGVGNDLETLTNYVKKRVIHNVSFLGFKPWSEAMEFVKNADCLLGQISSELETALPSKIFEYAISGRSVIFGLPNGPAKILAQQLHNFYLYNPGDSDELRKLLFQVKSKVVSEIEINKNRNFISENFIRELEAKKIPGLIAEYC